MTRGPGYGGGMNDVPDATVWYLAVLISVSSYMAAPPRQNRRRNPTRGGEGLACATKIKID